MRLPHLKDIAMLLHILAQIISTTGLRVGTAEQLNLPKFILLDIHLPVENGQSVMIMGLRRTRILRAARGEAPRGTRKRAEMGVLMMNGLVKTLGMIGGGEG